MFRALAIRQKDGSSPSSPALLRRSGGKRQRALNIRTPCHDEFQHELSFKLNLILSFMYKSVIRHVCHKTVSQAYKKRKGRFQRPWPHPWFGLE